MTRKKPRPSWSGLLLFAAQDCCGGPSTSKVHPFLVRHRGRCFRGLARHSATLSSPAAAGAPSKQPTRKGDTRGRPPLFLFVRAYVCKHPRPDEQKKVKLSFHLLVVCFELFPRIELGTSSLPRKCSTTELKQHLLPKSEAKVQRYFQLCNFFGENFLQKLLATVTTKHTTD